MNLEKFSEDLEVEQVEHHLIINKTHEILHQVAREAVFFMIATKDRLQSDNTLNAMPLAYALKGSLMNTEQAWQMIEMVKQKLYKNNIPVLCYCFDGQWRNCVMQDSCGNPLTWLQINACIWGHVSKMSLE